MPSSAASVRLLCAICLLACVGTLRAQQDTPASTPALPAPASGNPDGQMVEPVVRPKSVPELQEAAWVMLENAVNDEKHSDLRTQALAAVGLLGNSPRGLKMIQSAMVDHDIDIRSSAALAAGQTMAPAMTTPLRQMLDDKEPPVAFAAAVSLWKMKDYSGEDILMAVADGERSSSQGMISGAEHSMSRDLRHPGGIAKFAAMQGAGILLGPFGYGITAYEYLRKNGGDVARISAIELLAQNRTRPIETELTSALMDKDPGVRLAAAKALSTYRDTESSSAVAKLFDDSKPPVRLTAAASYLVSTGVAPGIPRPGAERSAPAGKPAHARK